MNKPVSAEFALLNCDAFPRPVRVEWEGREYAAATDLRTFVAVPDADTTDDADSASKLITMLSKSNLAGRTPIAVDAGALRAWAGSEARPVPECAKCGGAGTVRVECDECEGMKFVNEICPHCEQDWDHDCEKCDGAGTIDESCECAGPQVVVGALRFGARAVCVDKVYLARALSVLPQGGLAFEVPPTDTDPLMFTADNSAFALVMPRSGLEACNDEFAVVP